MISVASVLFASGSMLLSSNREIRPKPGTVLIISCYLRATIVRVALCSRNHINTNDPHRKRTRASLVG